MGATGRKGLHPEPRTHAPASERGSRAAWFVLLAVVLGVALGMWSGGVSLLLGAMAKAGR